MAKETVSQEILRVTGISKKKSEDLQVFLQRVVRSVQDLDEKEWETLTTPSQDWYNDAADQLNKRKKIDGLPGFEEEVEAPAETKSSKRGSSDAEAAPKSGRRRASEEAVEQAPAEEPKKGDKVKLTTKRGKDYEGEYVELDGEDHVLLIDGEEQLFEVSKTESVVVIPAEVKSSRRRASEEPAEAAEEKPARKNSRSKDADAEDEKPASTRAKKDPVKGSITQRIRELVCEFDEDTKAEIAQRLKDEDWEVKDGTLDITFAETQKTLTILREQGRLK